MPQRRVGCVRSLPTTAGMAAKRTPPLKQCCSRASHQQAPAAVPSHTLRAASGPRNAMPKQVLAAHVPQTPAPCKHGSMPVTGQPCRPRTDQGRCSADVPRHFSKPHDPLVLRPLNSKTLTYSARAGSLPSPRVNPTAKVRPQCHADSHAPGPKAHKLSRAPHALPASSPMR